MCGSVHCPCGIRSPEPKGARCCWSTASAPTSRCGSRSGVRSASRHTIAFDAPGTGGSSTPIRPLTMREIGTVTVGLLDALGYGTVDVLGYSFGGSIAQEMARVDPSRIHRLVLAAASCGWGSVPGDPFALLAMLTPARYYFLPGHGDGQRAVRCERTRRLRHCRCRPSASSARPARLLVAAARRARMVVVAVAPPCAGAHTGAGGRARPAGAREHREDAGASDSRRPARGRTRRQPLLPAARGHASRDAARHELPRRAGERISATRSWPARSCGTPRAAPASGRR